MAERQNMYISEQNVVLELPPKPCLYWNVSTNRLAPGGAPVRVAPAVRPAHREELPGADAVAVAAVRARRCCGGVAQVGGGQTGETQ